MGNFLIIFPVTGILAFRLPGLGSYLMRATASYSNEGLVAVTFIWTCCGPRQGNSLGVINTLLCLNSNTIELIVHPSSYCVLDLLCVNNVIDSWIKNTESEISFQNIIVFDMWTNIWIGTVNLMRDHQSPKVNTLVSINI